jgi:hypothetical protein
VATGWEIVRYVGSLCLLVSIAGWLVAWLRGERTIRDDNGRLKPAAALLASFALLLALPAVIGLILQ